MVKGFLILLNFFVLILLNLFLLQPIDIVHNPPQNLAPGQSAEVEVVINKGKIGGFAKFQLNAQAGLIIESVENSGASFTFHDQKAKFIWMSLPEDKSVTLRYRLMVAPTATGIKKIEGHFSYIDDNQRLVYDIPTVSITTTSDVSEELTEDSSPNVQALASVTREIIPLDNGRYRIELSIDKQNLTGFAKVQETISRDYTAIASESAEAVFNIVDNKVKFVWFDIPATQELLIAYELIPVTDQAQFSPITGDFSYLVNGETRTTAIGVEQPLISEESPIEEDPVDEVETETAEVLPEPELSEDEEAAPEIVEVEEVTPWDTGDLREPKEEDEAEPVAKPYDEPVTPETETPQETETTQINEEPEEEIATEAEAPQDDLRGPGIHYRVQISAAHKVVDANYFIERHKFNRAFFIEHHQGWIKYTTGNFDVYKAARDHRDQLRNGGHKLPGPFVTAYNEDERITVQEALMISNQKWVP